MTITASAASKTYDGNTLATVTFGDNRLAGDTLTITNALAHFADKHVGSNKVVSVSGILVVGAAAGNYTFNTNVTTTGDIGVRALTITASASDKPVLLRIDYASGHGMGSTKSQRQEQYADLWSFMLWQFGDARFQPEK